MANNKSRVQKTNESAVTKLPSNFLIRTLNNDLGGEAKSNRKVVDPRALLLLIKRLQSLDEVLSDGNVRLFELDSKGKTSDNPDVTRRFRAVNRCLRRYEATPSILPEYFSDPDTLSRAWELSWRRIGKWQQPYFEIGLVLQILSIASAGNISSLRQCVNCHKWLLARFPHQRYCSESCKDHFHKFNEADKKRRRDWARANYQSRKELELGSRKAAQRKGRKR